MDWPADFPTDVPFTITCESCDAGMEIGSYEEAIEKGWTEIRHDPDQLMAYFLGLCPDCRRWQEADELACG